MQTIPVVSCETPTQAAAATQMSPDLDFQVPINVICHSFIIHIGGETFLSNSRFWVSHNPRECR
jgi:hypothetical protein